MMTDEVKSLKSTLQNLIQDIIEIRKDGDFFIAIDPLTHLVGQGKTSKQATDSLFNCIILHIEQLKKDQTRRRQILDSFKKIKDGK